MPLRSTTSEREWDNALSEVRYLASINHLNVIAYKAAFIDEPSSTLCLVMEYAGGGDLHHKIKETRKNNQIIPEHTLLTIFFQICLAIKTLHSFRIMHRDLKVIYQVTNQTPLIRALIYFWQKSKLLRWVILTFPNLQDKTV